MNEEWNIRFQQLEAFFLPLGMSDHSPALLKIGQERRSPFKFFNFMAEMLDFLPMVEQIWRESI